MQGSLSSDWLEPDLIKICTFKETQYVFRGGLDIRESEIPVNQIILVNISITVHNIVIVL